MTTSNVSRLPAGNFRRPPLVLTAPVQPSPGVGRIIVGPALTGFLLIVIFLGGFSAWAALVPIASGAVASGVISPDGNRRIIQHYEGGIIAEILVRDGDEVAQGQPVIALEGRQAKASHDAVLAEYQTALAIVARLRAETLHAETVTYPAELVTDMPGAQAVIHDQNAIFERQRDYLAAQKSILQSRDEQLVAQVAALEAQGKSIERQLALNAEEMASKQALFDTGLATMPQLLELRRQETALSGESGRLSALMSEVGDKRAEVALQLLSLEAARADELASETDTARAKLATVSEQLNVSSDILDRTILTAPVSGKVVNSRFMSAGGVIRPAEPIMEIVPDQERLLIDARISVMDIDSVHSGMETVVHLTALASFRLPQIKGKVISVSGDRMTDPATGQAYFLARVEVSDESLALIGDSELVPGMPADVLLVTSTRTMAAYLFEPILATFRRSFREE
ncbi:HlyD family type I secretion periplasmic adaptor subunit [Rhodobacter sp. 24-YEA-8]|uniref:HlyD family type I secretion periplasmic adaptor subunit n=1 Tax=Rhodobacter sp. 24-YEA-8 TaxID=1884310 RepID=UPI0008980B68|nr:HlyD family type I secretion periplasmic adaptor subunit [Rhodobacter sp. 24-YEA-8]SED48988.1 HlyD family secretion protein/membrane fusion protein, epimerase transport system [Rhodobacter sp. 24-YEA-8]